MLPDDAVAWANAIPLNAPSECEQLLEPAWAHENMDAGAATVLEIFEKKHRLEVPLFQRQYVWNEEHQWAPLWEDIARKFGDYIAGRKDGPVHFLGAMVLDQKQTPTTHVEKRQVIDGQQRLTTLQIFLAAMRDFAREQGCAGVAAEFDTLTRNSGRMADPATECYKVWPTQRDRSQFCDVMDAGSKMKLEAKHPLIKKPRKRKPEPRPTMVEAYLFFHGEISAFFLGTPDEPLSPEIRPLEERLDEALHALRAAFKVVVIDLGDGDDAQVIFETLNARGEPLLPADLLRNYIFLRAARLGESPEQLYETHWRPFDDALWRELVRQGRLIRPRSDLFLQHYLSSRRFDEIPISHLFVEYKDWLAKAKPFPNVASELLALASAREDFRSVVISGETTPLGAFGRFLEIFDVGTVWPLLLVILESKPAEDDLAAMLRTLESYILRRAVCQLPTKAYNRMFLGVAAHLKKEGISNAILSARLGCQTGDTAVWPTDATFGAAFTTTAGYHSLSQGRIVYLLRKIDAAMTSRRTEQMTIQSELTVEHLMPQQWIENWPLPDGSTGMTEAEMFLEDDEKPSARCVASSARNLAVQQLGNLTLLTQPLNSSVSNSAWSAKRPEIAAHSALTLNRSLGIVDSWDEQRIAERSKALFGVALKLWPGPVASA